MGRKILLLFIFPILLSSLILFRDELFLRLKPYLSSTDVPTQFQKFVEDASKVDEKTFLSQANLRCRFDHGTNQVVVNDPKDPTCQSLKFKEGLHLENFETFSFYVYGLNNKSIVLYPNNIPWGAESPVVVLGKILASLNLPSNMVITSSNNEILYAPSASLVGKKISFVDRPLSYLALVSPFFFHVVKKDITYLIPLHFYRSFLVPVYFGVLGVLAGLFLLQVIFFLADLIKSKRSVSVEIKSEAIPLKPETINPEPVQEIEVERTKIINQIVEQEVKSDIQMLKDVQSELNVTQNPTTENIETQKLPKPPPPNNKRHQYLDQLTFGALQNAEDSDNLEQIFFSGATISNIRNFRTQLVLFPRPPVKPYVITTIPTIFIRKFVPKVEPEAVIVPKISWDRINSLWPRIPLAPRMTLGPILKISLPKHEELHLSHFETFQGWLQKSRTRKTNGRYYEKVPDEFLIERRFRGIDK